MFRKITLITFAAALIALGAGTAMGRLAGEATISLAPMIVVKDSTEGIAPLSEAEKTALNQCADKWEGVIDKVLINLKPVENADHETTTLKCSVAVNSSENRVVIARLIQTSRADLASGIVSLMDRAGNSLRAQQADGTHDREANPTAG